MAAGTKDHLKHSLLHLGEIYLWLKRPCATANIEGMGGVTQD